MNRLSVWGKCEKLALSLHYPNSKDIFQENKQGFDVESRTLTHFVAFEEHMADEAILRVA